MKKQELDLVLQEGEGQFIEFKESFDKSLAKEIVAFANASGGKIFLGINDKGKVKGVNVNNKLKSQLQDMARNCDPAIKINLDNIDNTIVIEVLEGNDKPYKCSNGFYVRQGANSQKMNRDDIIDMLHDLGKVSFDEKNSNVKKYDPKLVSKFLELAEIKSTINDNLMQNLGVFKNGFLNNAGVLFFTSNPKKEFVNAYVSCVRYKGIEKVKVIDRKDFDGNIVSQVEECMKFIERNTRLEYEIKGLVRKNIPEYPTEAVREALLNAVIHRDYFKKGGNVQVDIFDNRLTISNIGGLIKPLTKENLGTIAVRRNPILADLFHRINYVEKIGTGIKRIKEEVKKHGNISVEFETNGYMVVTFRFLTPQATPQATPQVTQLEKKIIGLLKRNNKLSRKELASKLKISVDTVKEYLNKLKKKGLLVRVGKTSAGYWEIK